MATENSMTHHGVFPFGRPNAERALRAASSGAAKVLVVGVYPSAFHVTWSPPDEHDPRPEHERRRAFIAALAVDVEPVVFWDGATPSPGELLARWKRDVGFDDAWGTVRAGLNGPSGAGLQELYLNPLGLNAADTAMTDVVPWFFVKQGAGSQGAALTRANSLASTLGFRPGELPSRPSTRALVEAACASPRRESLRRELVETGAALILTLGQEALDAVCRVADRADGVQRRLASDDEYGSVGAVTVGGARLSVLPLAHPGLLRQSKPDSRWRTTHRRRCAALKAMFSKG